MNQSIMDLLTTSDEFYLAPNLFETWICFHYCVLSGGLNPSFAQKIVSKMMFDFVFPI